ASLRISASSENQRRRSATSAFSRHDADGELGGSGIVWAVERDSCDGVAAKPSLGSFAQPLACTLEHVLVVACPAPFGKSKVGELTPESCAGRRPQHFLGRVAPSAFRRVDAQMADHLCTLISPRGEKKICRRRAGRGTGTFTRGNPSLGAGAGSPQPAAS